MTPLPAPLRELVEATKGDDNGPWSRKRVADTLRAVAQLLDGPLESWDNRERAKRLREWADAVEQEGA